MTTELRPIIKPFMGEHDFRFYNSRMLFCCHCGLIITNLELAFYGERDGTSRTVNNRESKCNAPHQFFYVKKVMGLKSWC